MILKYGDSFFDLDPARFNQSQVLALKQYLADKSPIELIKAAFESCTKEFGKFIPGERVVIVTSDVTRYSGSELYLPMLVDKLNSIGIKDSDITIIIALGIHRKQTETEHKKIVGSLYGRISVIDHDCDDTDNLIPLGKTSGGVDISVNRKIVEADRVILTGAIGFHYFAGFGGGRKSIVPGVASRRTCMESHFAVLNPGTRKGKNSKAVTGNLDENPVHQAMVEGCSMINPDLLINTVITPDKNIIACFAGDWRKAHEEGCRFYADNFMLPIDKLADLVIVSCGGFPKDINMIQSHKAMEYGSQALKEGGVMILLAECRDGYGNSTFADWFRFKDIGLFEDRLRSHYEINGQTAYSLYLKALKFKIILVSAFSPENVRNMGLIPAENLNIAVESAKEQLSEDYLTYIIPDGGVVLPRFI